MDSFEIVNYEDSETCIDDSNYENDKYINKRINNLEKKYFSLNQKVNSLENKINDMDKSILDNIIDFFKDCYNKIID